MQEGLNSYVNMQKKYKQTGLDKLLKHQSMITTKDDLRDFIQADRNRYSLRRPRILGALLNDESYYVTKFLYNLRKLEYYTNNRHSLFNKVLHIYWLLKYRRLERVMNIRIEPNTVGKGLYIPHYLGGIIINAIKLGDNCIVNSGVIIGNKNSQENRAIIGDNCEITIGAKIIGKVNIGNNVIVAPNSVVIKDIPSNAIVSGVPAKIIKLVE